MGTKSFFIQPSETIQLDAEHTITVRGLTWAERQQIALAAATKHPGNAAAAGVAMSSMAADTVIVAWSGPNFEGRDVVPGNIADLQPWIVEAVADTADRLSAPPSDAEKKASGVPTKR